MAAKPPKPRPGRKVSVDYNLERDPLRSGRTEDDTSTLRAAERWKPWDIRQWSFTALMLMLVVLIVGVAIVVLELFGVRFLSPWIDRWFESGP